MIIMYLFDNALNAFSSPIDFLTIPEKSSRKCDAQELKIVTLEEVVQKERYATTSE